MIDWLLAWDVGNSVFRPLLEKIATGAVLDFAKDFCKGSLNHVLHGQNEWRIATGRALNTFLEQFEQELIGAGETELSIHAYTPSVARFTEIPEVRQALGLVLVAPHAMVDYALLSRKWEALQLAKLPDGFDWVKLSRRYQNKTASILRELPSLRTIIDAQNHSATVDTLQRTVAPPAGFDTARYAQGLIARYSYLKLETLDANPHHQRIALTKVFVEQTVRSSQSFSHKIHELPIEYRSHHYGWYGPQRESFLQQQPIPVLTALNDPNKRLFVILGDPGSGKSVLLDYITMRWAELSPVKRTASPLPLLIELRTYAENLATNTCHSFLEFFDHGSGALAHVDQTEAHTILERGDAIFLLDGLDEIFDSITRQQVALDIVRYVTRYPKVRFILTSRFVGYELVADVLRNCGFHHFLLQDLDQNQQAQFITRWHELAYEDAAVREQKCALLRDAIISSAAIKELARNPLLLTLMSLLNRHQELPRDRHELYEQASKLMLQQWDASKALRADPLLAQQSFDYKDKQAMLRAVASRIQDSKHGLAGNLIPEEQLQLTLVAYLQEQGYMNPRPIAVRLIQQLRERNFILCLLGSEYFSFIHRTFLEFFVAWAWVRKFESQKIVTCDELYAQTFEAHWQDEKWHEVLTLIVARVEPEFAGRFISDLLRKKDPKNMHRPLLLAAKCFANVRNKAALSGVSVVLENRLKGLVTRRLRPRNPRLSAKTVRQDLSTRHLHHSRRQRALILISTEAVHAIAACWPGRPEIKDWFHSLLDMRAPFLTPPELYVAVLEDLARGWRSDPKINSFLKFLATNHESGVVRVTAIREVARNEKHPKEAFNWISTLGKTDRDLRVRFSAAQVLVRYYRTAPELLPWLKERVKYYQGAALAYHALNEASRSAHEDPSALDWLKGVVLAEQDSVLGSLANAVLTQAADSNPAWLEHELPF
jgi:hypothetical protein